MVSPMGRPATLSRPSGTAPHPLLAVCRTTSPPFDTAPLLPFVLFPTTPFFRTTALFPTTTFLVGPFPASFSDNVFGRTSLERSFKRCSDMAATVGIPGEIMDETVM